MIASPLTKVEEIINLLLPYMDQKQQLDVFTMQKYKREARQNLGTFPSAGHMALGMIAVLEWDEQVHEESYRNALGLRNDAATHNSFANTLQLLGKYDQAAVEACLASEMEPENLTYLEDAILYSLNAGRFSRARSLVDTFDLRNPREPHRDRAILDDALTVLEATGTTEDVVVDCNSIAFEVLRRNRVPFFRTRLEADLIDECVMYHIYVSVSAEELARLDDDLSANLFDRVSDFRPDDYWVGFTRWDLK
jgi:hypothetical protein